MWLPFTLILVLASAMSSLQEKVLFPGDEFVNTSLEQATKEVDAALEDSEASQNNLPQNSFHVLMAKERYPSAAALRAGRGQEIVERTIELVRENVDGLLRELISPDKLKLIAKEAGCAIVREDYECSDEEFHQKYSTIDGTCNNLEHPLWGASKTPFNRLRKAVFESGYNKPQGWNSSVLYYGFPKPSARLVSTKVVSAHKVKLDKKYTHFLMQWGQFLDHDMGISPNNPVAVSIKLKTKCSETCENAMPCFSIPVPEDDERIKDKKCLPFTRSVATCRSGDTVDREQINDITSYLDASHVYGSTRSLNERLRDPQDPTFLKTGLEVEDHPGKFLLPFDDGSFAACMKDPAVETSCFLTGDKRANAQLGLTSIHTLWMREHNRIAKELRDLNPHWDPETVYQEARKIVGAQTQVITYEAFLPKILGEEGMKMVGPYEGYNTSVDASIVASFASAAYRFGHGIINPEIQRLNKEFEPNNPHGNLPLHQAFFAPHRIVSEGGIDPVIRGFMYDGAKLPDPKNMVNTEMTEKLFALANKVALDLASLNIQRGRDHGMPSYVEMRQHCGLGEATSFDELADGMKVKRLRNRLREVYGDARNVDLWVGGLSEDLAPGARVGPVFRCILAEQFKRLRDGDRFFHENPGVFTPEQLTQIKKASLARIICNNADDIDKVQPDVFHKTIKGFRKCSNTKAIPEIDLSAWKDAQ